MVGLSFPQWDRFDRNGEYVTSNETNREERKEEEFSANLKTFFLQNLVENTKWGGLRGGNMSPQTKLIKRKGENEKGKSQARTKIIPANFVVKLSTR